jgi:glutamate-1-semialdehyde aminotransferase
MKAGSPNFVAHFGTWNGFPVACAAGVVALRMLRDGRVHDHINSYTARLRGAMNEVIARSGAGARVFGAGSHVHFYLRPWPFGESDEIPIGRHAELASDPKSARLLRLALYNEGLDFDFANNISALHGDAELDGAVKGFERAFSSLLEDGVLST